MRFWCLYDINALQCFHNLLIMSFDKWICGFNNDAYLCQYGSNMYTFVFIKTQVRICMDTSVCQFPMKFYDKFNYVMICKFMLAIYTSTARRIHLVIWGNRFQTKTFTNVFVWRKSVTITYPSGVRIHDSSVQSKPQNRKHVDQKCVFHFIGSNFKPFDGCWGWKHGTQKQILGHKRLFVR